MDMCTIFKSAITYAAQGWSLVNMTGLPEAVLARELAMCYTALALVTDLDAGVDSTSAVNQSEVFRIFSENTERLRDILMLDGIKVTLDLPGW